MSETRPGRGSIQFALRLPDGMREQIRFHAELLGRSMNAQIISMLQDWLNGDRRMVDGLEAANTILRRRISQETDPFLLGFLQGRLADNMEEIEIFQMRIAKKDQAFEAFMNGDESALTSLRPSQEDTEALLRAANKANYLSRRSANE
jgi:hypothetical protein